MQNVRTEIDYASFRHILNNVLTRRFHNAEELYLTILAIHALGLPMIQDSIVISENFVSEAAQALNENCKIVCDTRVLAVGVKYSLEKRGFSNSVICLSELRDLKNYKFIADVIENEPEIIENSLVLIGSSPMVLEKILNKKLRARAIIATPPGFLKAPQVKTMLACSDYAYVTVLGSVGCSSLCLALFNGLLDIVQGIHLKLLELTNMVSR